LKKRIFDTFSSQNRAVTKQDYISLCYSMPSKFGAIKRANIVQDNDSFKRNLNLYVVSEAVDGSLVKTNTTLKNNLKIWLNRYKMMNDSIDILDARIANIGINFVIVPEREKNKFDILAAASAVLRNKMSISNDVGSPFYITDIYKILNDVSGVVDVVDVTIEIKIGSNYSTTSFDIDEHMSLDRRYIRVPEDVILEVKFPRTDIQGAVV